jgi:hypothetical protein
MTAAWARKYGTILSVSLRNVFMYRGNMLGRPDLLRPVHLRFFSFGNPFYKGGNRGYTLPQMIGTFAD